MLGFLIPKVVIKAEPADCSIFLGDSFNASSLFFNSSISFLASSFVTVVPFTTIGSLISCNSSSSLSSSAFSSGVNCLGTLLIPIREGSAFNSFNRASTSGFFVAFSVPVEVSTSDFFVTSSVSVGTVTSGFFVAFSVPVEVFTTGFFVAFSVPVEALDIFLGVNLLSKCN